VAAVPSKRRAAPGSERLINRELSFLDYGARLLDLAGDDDLPLLERVFFLSVFGGMLDEFFMVRIAGLTGQAAAGVTVRSPDGRAPQQTLADARRRVLDLYADEARVWTDELCPALAAEGIVISRIEDLTDPELAELDARFERQTSPCSRRSPSGPDSRSRTSPRCRSVSRCSSPTRRRGRCGSRA
jgi:polyphosphate kinase